MSSIGEKFYDEHIAPRLLELGKLCQDNGLCLLATVEWTEDDKGSWSSGRTWSKMGDQSGFMNWLNVAAQCGEEGAFNIDKLVITMMRDSAGRPTQSAVLEALRMKALP